MAHHQGQHEPQQDEPGEHGAREQRGGARRHDHAHHQQHHAGDGEAEHGETGERQPVPPAHQVVPAALPEQVAVQAHRGDQQAGGGRGEQHDDDEQVHVHLVKHGEALGERQRQEDAVSRWTPVCTTRSPGASRSSAGPRVRAASRPDPRRGRRPAARSASWRPSRERGTAPPSTRGNTARRCWRYV